MFAVPFVGATLTIVRTSPSGSLSFAKAGIVTATFFGVLPVSFTAIGGRLVTAVTTGVLTLFERPGSNVGLPTNAKFVTVPREIAVTLSVRFVTAPDARLPRFVQTIWPPKLAAAGIALTKDSPDGKLSVTDKAVAATGPKFVTEIV